MKTLKRYYNFLTKPDKLKHYIAGFLMLPIFMIFLPVVWALGLSLAVGLLKEAYDLISKKGTPEMWDMLMTWLGTFTFYLIYILLK